MTLSGITYEHISIEKYTSYQWDYCNFYMAMSLTIAIVDCQLYTT